MSISANSAERSHCSCEGCEADECGELNRADYIIRGERSGDMGFTAALCDECALKLIKALSGAMVLRQPSMKRRLDEFFGVKTLTRERDEARAERERLRMDLATLSDAYARRHLRSVEYSTELETVRKENERLSTERQEIDEAFKRYRESLFPEDPSKERDLARREVERMRAERDIYAKVYSVAACLRTFPVPFDDHLRLVDAVDECRQAEFNLATKDPSDDPRKVDQ